MTKYGKGLNKEAVIAVNRGELIEPITTKKLKEWATSKGWNVPDSYIKSALADGTSPSHSETYRKYFKNTGSGEYEIKHEFRGMKDYC